MYYINTLLYYYINRRLPEATAGYRRLPKATEGYRSNKIILLIRDYYIGHKNT